MKGLILLALAAYLAVDAGPVTEVVGPAGSLASHGVLGVIIGILLYKTIPGIVRSHKEAIEKQTAAHISAEHQRHTDSVELNRTLQMLRDQCALSTGKGGE